MEIRLHLDPKSRRGIIREVKKAFADAEASGDRHYGGIEVGGLRFHQDERGTYASFFEPVLPPPAEALPIALVTLQVEVDVDLRIGNHDRGKTQGWVTSTTKQNYGTQHPERQLQFRNIRVYGPDLESVLRLYREILGRALPTPVSVSEGEPAKA